MAGTTQVQINMRIDARMAQALEKRASAAGYATSAYARLLFEAAFAARIGQERDEPPVDAELDEQVRLVFACAGQANTAAISRATGVPEARVARILDGFGMVRKESRK